jgi:hypothetical protein
MTIYPLPGVTAISRSGTRTGIGIVNAVLARNVFAGDDAGAGAAFDHQVQAQRLQHRHGPLKGDLGAAGLEVVHVPVGDTPTGRPPQPGSGRAPAGAR